MSPFCKGEGLYIQNDELLADNTGTIVKPYIHNVPGNLHYVDTGAPVSNPDKPPGIVSIVKTLMKKMPRTDLQELINFARQLIDEDIDLKGE